MKRNLWLKILAIMMLVVQGLYDLMPCYATLISISSQKPVQTVTLPSHSEYCRCRMCAGDKKCCCRPTHTLAEAVTMTAACDTPDEAQVARSIELRAVPPLFMQLPLTPISEKVPLPTLTQTAPSRASQPPTQPPRLS